MWTITCWHSTHYKAIVDNHYPIFFFKTIGQSGNVKNQRQHTESTHVTLDTARNEAAFGEGVMLA